MFKTINEAAHEEGLQEGLEKGSNNMFEKVVNGLIRKSNGQLTYEEAKEEALDLIGIK